MIDLYVLYILYKINNLLEGIMNLKRWRRVMGFKQQDAADLLGIPVYTYASYENGGGFSFENLIKILHRGEGKITLEALARFYKQANKEKRKHIKESHLKSLRKQDKLFKRFLSIFKKH